MSATSTTYDVRVKYMVDDTRAKTGMRSVAREADKAGKSVDGLGQKLKTLMTGAVAYLGFRAAYKALVGYNAELENTQAQLRTVFQLNTKGTFADSSKTATLLMRQFKVDARQSAGTMQDMANFASNIANSVLQAGGGSAELREITKGSIVASKAMFPDMHADMAALDVQQAMNGTLTSRDKFAKALLSSQGMTQEQFNSMAAADRMKAWMKALQDPAIKDAAKAYENSWAGTTSTLKENFQSIMGQVGLPLFKALSKEVQNMNDWISKNTDKLAAFATDFAGTLKTGFGFIRGIVGFIVEHKTLLMTLAKAWLIHKVVTTGVQGLVVHGIGALAKLGQLQESMKAGGGFAAFSKGLASSAAGLAVLATATYAFASWVAEKVDQGQSEQLDKTADIQSFRNQFQASQKYGGGSAMVFRQEAERRGLIGPDGKFDKMKAMRAGLLNPALGGVGWGASDDVQSELNKGTLALTNRKLQTAILGLRISMDAATTAQWRTYAGQERFRAQLATWKSANAGLVGAFQQLSMGFGKIFSQFQDMMGMVGLGGMFFKSVKPQVNIGKLVMNVESNDPDNFAIGMEGYFRQWTSNPTSNPKSIREGR